MTELDAAQRFGRECRILFGREHGMSQRFENSALPAPSSHGPCAQLKL